MPGPIQSGISGILTTAAGAAVAGKHLANEEEARLADLEQLRADTAEQLKKEDTELRKEFVQARETTKTRDTELRAREMYDEDKKKYFGLRNYSQEKDYYRQRAAAEYDSETYRWANMQVDVEYHNNPARALQKEFAEGGGDKIFATKQKYLAELNRKRTEYARRKGLMEHLDYYVMSQDPNAMSELHEEEAKEYFRQQNEKEADE